MKDSLCRPSFLASFFSFRATYHHFSNSAVINALAAALSLVIVTRVHSFYLHPDGLS